MAYSPAQKAAYDAGIAQGYPAYIAEQMAANVGRVPALEQGYSLGQISEKNRLLEAGMSEDEVSKLMKERYGSDMEQRAADRKATDLPYWVQKVQVDGKDRYVLATQDRPEGIQLGSPGPGGYAPYVLDVPQTHFESPDQLKSALTDILDKESFAEIQDPALKQYAQDNRENLLTIFDSAKNGGAKVNETPLGIADVAALQQSQTPVTSANLDKVVSEGKPLPPAQPAPQPTAPIMPPSGIKPPGGPAPTGPAPTGPAPGTQAPPLVAPGASYKPAEYAAPTGTSPVAPSPLDAIFARANAIRDQRKLPPSE